MRYSSTLFKRSSYIPKPPQAKKSPLLDHFHKWAGKRTFLERTSDYDELDQKFLNLESNVFFRLLSSPVRVDRLSSIHCPRELLLRLSLAKDSQDKIWLVPNVDNFRSRAASTYTANNKKHIADSSNKWQRLLSYEVQNTVTNITSISDVSWNPSNHLLINKLYLRTLINELKETVQLQWSTTPEENDWVINFNDEDDRFVIKGSVVHVNLSKYSIESPNYELFEQPLRAHEDPIVIKSCYKKFIDTFYKMLVYNGPPVYNSRT